MVPVNWCCSSCWRRELKVDKKSVTQLGAHVKTLSVEVQKSSETDNLRPTSLAVPVPFRFVTSFRRGFKVMSHDACPVAADPEVERNDSDHNDANDKMHGEGLEMIESEHISDPGGWKPEFWPPPELKRSCSDLAMTSMSREVNGQLPSLISKSYDQKKRLTGQRILLGDDAKSPVSVCSADNVILKKHSSSRVLPSGSRKLWWKLFLWSHRNLHRTRNATLQQVEVKPSTLNQEGGYSSDCIEPKSHSFLARESKETDRDATDNHSCDGFCGGLDTWTLNQWVAFPMNSSPLDRISEWIAQSSKYPPYQGDDYLISERKQPGEASVLHANNVIRSLNANTAVAHITGIGLNVVPMISHLVSLRTVHLSGNSIAHIPPGSLPKGLHILDLSKNKLSTIQGLRELTRLRVLNLSYNRISSIGQGLSTCTLIKELCLAGNKISNVEGLHRLLKLTDLDLSFNKITTAKALGQLVANHGSLVSMNLLGNPVQSNTSDGQLRKMMCSLLPKLALLNRQPVKPQKGREIHAKSALVNSDQTRRKRSTQRSSHVGPSGESKTRIFML